MKITQKRNRYKQPHTAHLSDFYRPHPKDDGRLYFHFVCQSTKWGGESQVPVSDPGGGPRSQIFGGSQVSDFGGGPRSQIFRGDPRSQIFGGGYPVSDFWGGPRSQIFLGGHPVSDFQGGYPVSVKRKIFDTRFGLIHVQTGKKYFCRGTPPPVKGKNFDTRFGLMHVQTGKKIFCQGIFCPPPPSKGKHF